MADLVWQVDFVDSASKIFVFGGMSGKFPTCILKTTTESCGEHGRKILARMCGMMDVARRREIPFTVSLVLKTT
jgi:hypothetical protein